MRKVFIALLFLVLFATSVNGAKFNESFDDLELVYVGWCKDYNIKFSFYNKTEYGLKSPLEKEKEFCDQSDDDPDRWDTFEEDGCFDSYQSLSGSSVIVYGGPIESLGIIHETTLDANNSFTYSFDEENGYLLEITNSGNFNAYYDTVEVLDCNLDRTEKKLEVIQDIEYFNQSYSFSTEGVNLEIENTTIINKNNITITEIDINSSNINTLPDTKKIVNISGSKNATFNNMEISYGYIPKEFSEEIKVYIYEGNGWTPVTDFTNENNIIEFEVSNFEIFAIVDIGEEPEPEIIEEAIEEIPEEPEEEIIVVEDTNNPVEVIDTNENNSNMLLIVGIGFGSLLLIIAIIYGITKLLGTMSDEEFDYSKYDSNKKPKTDGKHEEHNIEDSTKLSTYQTTYDKTKDYVRKYKSSYGKDLIYHSLERANVPKDIIDKVFREEAI